MPERSSFCCLFLFLFCFLLLTNFLFHYVFYGGTEIKDTDTDTNFAISLIYDSLVSNIDNNLYTCIFLDLSKAFDTVDHELLLHKTSMNFGIRGKPLELFKSYLSDRLQYTNIRNTMSDNLKVACGFLQGSCLGPCLFLLYI